jgi:hypothetical protein
VRAPPRFGHLVENAEQPLEVKIGAIPLGR